MKLSFDHVHIICNDVEKMKDYFVNVFDGSLEFLDEIPEESKVIEIKSSNYNA